MGINSVIRPKQSAARKQVAVPKHLDGLRGRDIFNAVRIVLQKLKEWLGEGNVSFARLDLQKSL